MSFSSLGKSAQQMFNLPNATQAASLAGMGSVAGLVGEPVIRQFVESSPILSKAWTFFTTYLNIDFATWTLVIALLGTFPRAFGQLHDAVYSVGWWLARHFMSSVSISPQDGLNKDVINWVSHKVLPRSAARILSAKTEKANTGYHSHWSGGPVQRDDVRHEKRVPIQYLPYYGITWFVHDWNLFFVKRVAVPSGNGHATEYSSVPDNFDPLIVMCLGRSPEPIKKLFEDCRDFSDQQRRQYVTVRSSRKDAWPSDETWGCVMLRPVRDLETVHFDEEVKRQLVKDIRNYLDSNTRRFYNARGIPYRRGYLLHGPPGTGKTSLSLALASLFDLDLYLCHIPSIKNDGDLEQQFASLPPKCIVLLEDIDAVGIDRMRPRGGDGNANDDADSDADSDDGSDSDSDSGSSSSRRRRGDGCTLSGVLNVLDGVSSQEGRIVFMTSNFAHRLDRALVRPGRIDRMIYLGTVSKRSAELMFLRMYAPAPAPTPVSPAAKAAGCRGTDVEEQQQQQLRGEAALVEDIDPEQLSKLAGVFSDRVPGEALSPAQLQGFLLGHRQDPRAAVEGVAAWAEEEIRNLEELKARAKKERKKRRERKKRLKATHVNIIQNTPKDLELEEGKKEEVEKDAGDEKVDVTCTKAGETATGE